MTKNDSKAPNSIEAYEEFLTKQLTEATDPFIREMAERALSHCADLKMRRELDEEIRNASPEEIAYYAFLEELERIKKARATGGMDKDETLFRIAWLILPRANAAAEKGLQIAAPSLWPQVKEAREGRNNRQTLERTLGFIEEVERAGERMIASTFRLHGETEIADLYENDIAEFDRRYERGRQISLAQNGSTERRMH